MGHEDRKIPTGFATFEEIDIVQRVDAGSAPSAVLDVDPDAMPEIMRICTILPLKARHAALAAALAQGEDPDATCPFGAMPIDTLYTDGDGVGLAMLLAHGAQADDYGWNAAHLAVIAGDGPALAHCDPAKLTQADQLGDTPFLLACRFGQPKMVRALMPATIPPLAMLIAAESGSVPVMAALIAAGGDVDATLDNGNCALLSAIEHGQVEMVAALLAWDASLEARIDLTQPVVRAHPSVVTGVELMIARMMDALEDVPIPTFTTIYSAAKVPDMVRLLVDHGADPTRFHGPAFAAAVGLDQVKAPSITRDVFAASYRVRFGQANPERLDPLFWQAQMRTGRSGTDAKAAIAGPNTVTQGPVWSFDRKGRSASLLLGGDWLLIGGMHSTPSRPEHAIYNDVTLVSPNGAIRHFAYPPRIFAPTAGHSATCVDDGVWIIGGQGYARDTGRLSVTWLSLEDYSMNPIQTLGRAPGSISGHSATLLDGAIYVSGGQGPDGAGMLGAYVLDLATRAWHRVN